MHVGKIQLDEVQPGQEQPLTVGIVEPAATEELSAVYSMFILLFARV